MNGNKDNTRFVNIISQNYLLVGVRGPENRFRSPIRNHRRRSRLRIVNNEHRPNSTRHRRVFRDYLLIGGCFRKQMSLLVERTRAMLRTSSSSSFSFPLRGNENRTP